MKRKGIYIARQVLLAIVALQILNLSIGDGADAENNYDYSYAYNKTFDPTESAVEWIVELNYGQQPAFSYDVHQEDAGKTPVKPGHWKTDIQHYTPLPLFFPRTVTPHAEMATGRLQSPDRELISPPPKISVA